MQRKFRVDYDPENDSLFLYRAKSKGSVEIGNFILDFDANKDLVGIEIFKASKFLQKMNISDSKISKSLLKSVNDSRVNISHDGGFLFIEFLLLIDKKEVQLAPFPVPSIKETSPLAASV